MKNNFEMQVKSLFGYKLFVLNGPISFNSEDTFSHIKKNVSLKKQRHIIIDFELVTYINSAGMATILDVVLELFTEGFQIYFVSLSNHYIKVVDMIGMNDFVTVFSNAEEAISHIY